MLEYWNTGIKGLEKQKIRRLENGGWGIEDREPATLNPEP
jgi:hypothetical protein